MSIHRRGNSIEVRYYGSDGQQRRKSFSIRVYGSGAKATAAAREFEAEQLRQKRRGEWLDPALGRMTVDALCQEWATTLGHLKEKTSSGYLDRYRLTIQPTFGSRAGAKVSSGDISTWMTELRRTRSASTVRNSHQVLSHILE